MYVCHHCFDLTFHGPCTDCFFLPVLSTLPSLIHSVVDAAAGSFAAVFRRRTLRHQIEGIDNVERAFVHVDYARRAMDEHKVERNLKMGEKDVMRPLPGYAASSGPASPGPSSANALPSAPFRRISWGVANNNAAAIAAAAAASASSAPAFRSYSCDYSNGRGGGSGSGGGGNSGGGAAEEGNEGAAEASWGSCRRESTSDGGGLRRPGRRTDLHVSTEFSPNTAMVSSPGECVATRLSALTDSD
ncbi:hypothetical protein Vretimale_4223 [Volvox reticuliferus]|uniref:Uncharacterized protein n=1 Tax=Volvox reticuliferus TaxID=1737510 RepID=A0A8J4DF60_9CHLO|nr:hypothetical protein Vretifemale_2780 [Volvox reticuliferus]GIL98891.1 hypothetical protein Vretimale_4223 [Volvox reticuliferus]